LQLNRVQEPTRTPGTRVNDTDNEPI
jgi:hypothetical protein